MTASMAQLPSPACEPPSAETFESDHSRSVVNKSPSHLTDLSAIGDTVMPRNMQAGCRQVRRLSGAGLRSGPLGGCPPGSLDGQARHRPCKRQAGSFSGHQRLSAGAGWGRRRWSERRRRRHGRRRNTVRHLQLQTAQILSVYSVRLGTPEQEC